MQVLVSSDVSSRGIDVDRINMVVNLELPSSHETYLHRLLEDEEVDGLREQQDREDWKVRHLWGSCDHHSRRG